MSLPSLFLSHGAPTLPLTDVAAREFLTGLGAELERPRAILVISAHWETARPTVNAVAWNETIHDFHGFPRALYDLRYAAPGSPELAARVVELLGQAGTACDVDDRRGLDHGAWVPLLLMYPTADIPVVQLSVQSHLGPAHHLRMGQAIAALRDEGVLIIGSGSLTHDLSRFRGQGVDSQVLAGVNEFAEWVGAALAEGRVDELLDYRRQAPFAARNHPSEEHFLPLFAALGAAGTAGKMRRLHESVTYGILRMDVYAFETATVPQQIAA